MLVVLDAIGIVAGAFVGAADAVRCRLDLFGVIVAASVTAIGGGVARDVLLGIYPPKPLLTWWYHAACVATALLVFFLYRRTVNLRLSVQIPDAVGLSFFAITGATAAAQHGYPLYFAALIGMINGIGGGLLRDMMMARTPTVLRADIYALPALGAGLLTAVGIRMALPIEPTALAIVALVIGVRVLAIRHGWQLATGNPEPDSGARTVVLPAVTTPLPARRPEPRHGTPVRPHAATWSLSGDLDATPPVVALQVFRGRENSRNRRSAV